MMQLFPTAAPRGTSAVDTPSADGRPAVDPTGGDGFRAALTSARRATDGTAAPGGARETADMHQLSADAEPVADDELALLTDAAITASALAMLLPLVEPAPQAAGTGTRPASAGPEATGPVESAPIGAPAIAPRTASTGDLLRLGAPATGAAPLGGPKTATGTATAPGASPVTGDASGPVSDLLGEAVLPTGQPSPAPGGWTPGSATSPASAAPAAATTAPVVSPAAPTVPAGARTAGTPAAGGQATAAQAGADASAATSGPSPIAGDGPPQTTVAQAGASATTAARAGAPAATPDPVAGAAAGSAWGAVGAELGARVVAMSGGSEARPTTGSSRPTGTAPTTAATGSTGAVSPQASAGEPLPIVAGAGAGAGSGVNGGLPGAVTVPAAGQPSPATAQGTAPAGTFAEAVEAAPAAGATARRAEAGGASAEAQAAALSAGASQQAQSIGSAPAAGAVSAPPVASQIADGAVLAARRGGQSVEVVLQPEGLGTVSLRVSVERSGLGIHLAVDSPHARELIQAGWQQLQQALDQRGLSVQNVFLDLTGGHAGGDGFQAFQQFGGQQFAGSQFSGQHGRPGAGPADRLADQAAGSGDATARPQAGVATATRVDYRI